MATKVDKIVRATKIAEKFKEKIHEHRLADHVHEAFPKLEKELDPSLEEKLYILSIWIYVKNCRYVLEVHDISI